MSDKHECTCGEINFRHCRIHSTDDAQEKPEKCFRCLGEHANLRCDDDIHHGSALPYPQVVRSAAYPGSDSAHAVSKPDTAKDGAAREWSLPLNTLIINSDFNRPNGVHVIEYSAFEAERAEVERIQENKDGWQRKAEELHAENLALRANQLRSFDVAVPSDEWYDTVKERDTLKEECERLKREVERLQTLYKVTCVDDAREAASLRAQLEAAKAEKANILHNACLQTDTMNHHAARAEKLESQLSAMRAGLEDCMSAKDDREVERLVSHCGDWVHVSALAQITKVTIKFSLMSLISRIKIAYAAMFAIDCDVNLSKPAPDGGEG